jgi:methionine-S-sulfoxide reductase
MTQKATFAAGCFWGVQAYFDQIPGVVSSRVGYIGGHTKNPTYEQVCEHNTGHAEAVELEFDPKKVSYKTLLKHILRIHDPTQLNRQGPDIGDNYRSAIFYHSDEQKDQATQLIDESKVNYKIPIVTQVVPATEFYLAEEYHQKFTEKTGQGSCHIAYKPL